MTADDFEQEAPSSRSATQRGAETERPVISVAELDRKLKRAVEGASGRDWVQGEVSALKRAASGHTYFTLKDEREEAIIDCVMYRFQAQRARRFLVEGTLLQVLGRATLWAPRGRLQLVVEAARPAGRGALLEALERLKAKLAAEGLFDRSRKRPLPRKPHLVGVITSAQGAAWHDIRTVALRRAPLRLLLCPALVQGDGAPESLLRALGMLEKVNGLDAVIIGRGGGSAEDLMAFNDERLVRRLASCAVPTVSAVGHEIDTSLCDLVADARAATPSEAAELLVPDQASELRQLGALAASMAYAMRARLDEDRAVLENLRLKIADPRFVIAEKQQLIDDLSLRMERFITRELKLSAAALTRQRQRLAGQHPRVVVARSKTRLVPLSGRLIHAMDTRLRREQAAVRQVQASLQALSPVAILSRGYSIVLDEHGRAVRASTDTTAGARLHARLGRGGLEIRVEKIVSDE